VVAVLSAADLLLLPKGVTDSKKLSPARRESFFEHICAACTDIGIGAVDAWEIDAISPKRALQTSYKRAIEELRVVPELLIVDGTEWNNKVLAWPNKQLIEPKADLKHKQVSVASIIAKVVRDTVMSERAAKFRRLGLPDYNWAKNKGYLTPDHLREIEQHGLLFGPAQELYHHRRSYCRNLLGKVPIRTF